MSTKKIKFNVKEPYYSFIKNGQKIAEGRLDKGKFSEIKAGDILLLGINQEDNHREKYLVTAKNSILWIWVILALYKSQLSLLSHIGWIALCIESWFDLNESRTFSRFAKVPGSMNSL